MNLLRLIILALVIWLVYRTVKRWAQSRQAIGRGERRPAIEDDMVRCRRCGVHVPRREAVDDGEDWYCSPAHRDADE